MTREFRDVSDNCWVPTGGLGWGLVGACAEEFLVWISFDSGVGRDVTVSRSAGGTLLPGFCLPVRPLCVRAGVTVDGRLTFLNIAGPGFGAATGGVFWRSMRSRSTVTIEFTTEAFL